MKVFQVGNGLVPPSVGEVQDFVIDNEGVVHAPEGPVVISDLFGDAFPDKNSFLSEKDDRFLFSPQNENAAYELNPPKRTRKTNSKVLTEDQVRAVLKERAEKKTSFGKIGAAHQISTYLVQKICKGEIYGDVESPHREAAFKVDRSSNRKLTDQDVLAIRKRYQKDESILQLALDYNCSSILIKDVVLGKSYTDVVDPDEVQLVDPVDDEVEEEE